MVRVQGGGALLQAPAGHPIRAGLVSMKSSWGQGEQERSLAALEAAGFQGVRHAPWSMGEGSRQRAWRGERSLPDGADPSLIRTPEGGSGNGIGKRHLAGDATGAQRPLPRWFVVQTHLAVRANADL